MRQVTAYLSPQEIDFDPAEEDIRATPSVQRQAIHHFNVLTDETVVLLEELQGSYEQVDEIYGGQPRLKSYDIADTEDNLYLYVRFEPTPAVSDLFTLPQEHEILVDTPIEYGEGGAIRVTLVGEQSELQSLLNATPDAVGVDVEHISEYKPKEDRLFSKLTPEQQEVLVTAVSEGYFKIPRQTTTSELADHLGISPSAVSKRLRRVESNILPDVVPQNI